MFRGLKSRGVTARVDLRFRPDGFNNFSTPELCWPGSSASDLQRYPILYLKFIFFNYLWNDVLFCSRINTEQNGAWEPLGIHLTNFNHSRGTFPDSELGVSGVHLTWNFVLYADQKPKFKNFEFCKTVLFSHWLSGSETEIFMNSLKLQEHFHELV